MRKISIIFGASFVYAIFGILLERYQAIEHPAYWALYGAFSGAFVVLLAFDLCDSK